MKKILILLLSVLIVVGSVFCITSCGTNNNNGGNNNNNNNNNNNDGVETMEEMLKDSDFDKEVNIPSVKTTITLNNANTTYKGTGVAFDSSTGVVSITQAGVYVLSGTLNGGQIYVNVDDQVRLVLNGVNITCNDSAPIAIFGDKKKVVTLYTGTTNVLTDASTYTKFYNTALDEPNSALYADKKLTINGTGSLNVTANFNNGIGSKAGLRIMSGNITVNAKKNAIKGNDYVIIKNGTLNLTTTSGDAIKSDNEIDVGLGFVHIEAGNITVKSGDDGIQAINSINVVGGTFNFSVKGKKTNLKSTTGTLTIPDTLK